MPPVGCCFRQKKNSDEMVKSTSGVNRRWCERTEGGALLPWPPEAGTHGPTLEVPQKAFFPPGNASRAPSHWGRSLKSFSMYLRRVRCVQGGGLQGEGSINEGTAAGGGGHVCRKKRFWSAHDDRVNALVVCQMMNAGSRWTVLKWRAAICIVAAVSCIVPLWQQGKKRHCRRRREGEPAF